MNRLSMVVLSGLVLLGASMVHAEEKVTIKEKEFRKSSEQAIKDVLDPTNAACGSSITMEINWATFKPSERGDNSVSGYCEPPLNALWSICKASEAGKESIAKSVKKVVCSNGPKEKFTLSEKDGIVQWTVGWGASNLDQKARDYFENNL